MKKILFTFALICSYAAFVISQQAEPAIPTQPTPIVGTPSKTQQPTTSKAVYRDGTYLGNAVDVIYGYVQVKTTISSGKIVDIQFLDYPKDRTHSMQLSNMAMPMLKVSAMNMQSANVDTVSGASETSLGFRQSLQSALDQAKI